MAKTFDELAGRTTDAAARGRAARRTRELLAEAGAVSGKRDLCAFHLSRRKCVHNTTPAEQVANLRRRKTVAEGQRGDRRIMLSHSDSAPMASRSAAAKSRFDEAGRRLTELVRGAFPVGSRAAWPHGAATRSGTVVEACGWDFGSLKFRVRSAASGRVYWIAAEKLLSYASAYYPQLVGALKKHRAGAAKHR
jgi:hypothetical protein